MGGKCVEGAVGMVVMMVVGAMMMVVGMMMMVVGTMVVGTVVWVGIVGAGAIWKDARE